ncbi:MAG: plasmid pRiA4b ORF-3 family protein, partial [Gammaproteobacteria bacterium]|nr:plasmid pRiA4b ORF-3 family protein [Gammaproteobacteria bacterium]
MINAPYPIERKLLVPAETDLHQLHFYLQLAMGWQLSHLHMFITAKGNFSDYEDDFEPGDELLEFDVPITDVLHGNNNQIKYLYDYGDDWMHTIQLEESVILPADTGVKLVHARGVRPEEDSGGVYHLRKNSQKVDCERIQSLLQRFYNLTVTQGYAPHPAFIACMEDEDVPFDTELNESSELFATDHPMFAAILEQFSHDISQAINQQFKFATLNEFNRAPYDHGPYRIAAPADHLVQEAPILQALAPLFAALRLGHVKLTASGYLPVKLVQAIDAKLHNPQIPLIQESQFEKVTSESKTTAVAALRHILCLSPLVKEYKTKIELTAKGRKLLEADNLGEIYLSLLQSALQKFNWGFIDYSDECQLQQHVAPLMILQSAVAPELEIIDEILYASLSAMVPALHDEPVTTSQWTAPTPNHARVLHFRRRYVYIFGLLGLWTHSASSSHLASLEPRKVQVTPLCRSLIVHGS